MSDLNFKEHISSPYSQALKMGPELPSPVPYVKSSSFDILWVVVPVCLSVVLILLIVLLVLVAR